MINTIVALGVIIFGIIVFVRTNREVIIRTNSAIQNPVYYENGQCSQYFHPHDSKFITTHTFINSTKLFHPPLHFHSYQDESFYIDDGTAEFFMSEDGSVPSLNNSITKNTGEEMFVPAGAYHRFESKGEKLSISFYLSPKDRVVEERFFRNFFGYLDDCLKAQVEPSIFQLLRFLYDVGSPLAVPMPHILGPSVGRAVSRFICWFGGLVIGEYGLGYQESYDSYYKI
ncbi:RmlC-like cupin [Acrasis kona]|uniref:RmlC-like cupin n=1 Tax=Acrasis kona TaxID=1008807 RepID=A0AAW2ZAJ6_9EUKA